MIIDTGAGVSRTYPFVMAADETVIRCRSHTATTDAYGIIKSIAAQSRQDHQIIVNQVQSVAEGTGGATGNQHRRAVPEYKG